MSFVNEQAIKATRKRHTCDTCRKIIEIGSPAMSWAGIHDGEFQSGIRHLECRAAEIEFNDLLDYRAGDDWTPLSDIECDMHDWLFADHPLVAERMGIPQPHHSTPDPANSEGV